MAEVTCARIHPLVALVTPRSRYLKKSRRPLTNSGAFALVTAIFIAGCASAALSFSAVCSIVILQPPRGNSAAIIAAPAAMLRGPPSRCREIGVNLPILFQGGSHGQHTRCGNRSRPRARRQHGIQERQRNDRGLSRAAEPDRALSRHHCHPRG